MIISNSSFGIGDAIHGLYAVEAYKQNNPSQEVVYLCRQPHWLMDVEGITIKPYVSGEGVDIHNDYSNKLRDAISSKTWYTSKLGNELLPIRPKMKISYKGNSNFIVLAPHASRSNRTWSLNNWVQLEKKIRKELNLKTIIIGTEGYQDNNKFIRFDYSQFKGKVLINKSPIQIRDTIINCNLLITCESGMAHFAGLYNVPTLSIATQLRASYLYDYTNIMTITSNRACNNCHFQTNKGYQSVCDSRCYALKGISVNVVYDKIVCFHNYEDKINELFDKYLHRQVDSHSLDTLRKEYIEGKSMSDIERSIINSHEYHRHTTQIPYDDSVDITINMGVQESDGIGKVGLRYYNELKKLDVGVSPIVDVLVKENLKSEVCKDLIENNYRKVGKSYIATGCSGLIPQPLPRFVLNGNTNAFRYSMFEADKLPDEWIRAYNNEETEAIIVPDEWVKQVFINSGITKPVEVATLGCDVKPLNEFKNDGVFTFGITSQFEERKNHLLVIQAFKLAFQGRNDVRLKVHGRWGHLADMLEYACKDDDRIEFINYCLPNITYKEWWESLDAYIIVSSGEGFGFTPREALMRGIPTIVSNCTAHKKLVNAEIVIPVEPSGMKEAYKAIFGRVIGKDYIIEVEDVAKAMNNVINNHEVEKEIALIGRKWLIENESWGEAAKQLLNTVKKYEKVLV